MRVILWENAITSLERMKLIIWRE